MDKLSQALARLEQAVARLEAALARAPAAAETRREIARHLDTALARIGGALGEEE